MAREGISGVKVNPRTSTGIARAMEDILAPIPKPDVSPEKKKMALELTHEMLNKFVLAAQRNYDWEEIADVLDITVQEVMVLKTAPEVKRYLARGRRLRKDKVYDAFNDLLTAKNVRIVELGAKCDLGMNPTNKIEANINADITSTELTKEQRETRIAQLLAKQEG